MAKRRVKKRTHVGADQHDSAGKEGIPRSMVIRINASDIGASITQLVKDIRKVMEPHTAARLKERRNNKLRDYVTMTGALGVSHLLLFSKSEAGNLNLRFARTPRGPTLNFRVEKYSLAKDVLRSQKHPRSAIHEFQNPPLLVMNNFMTSDADREKLGDAAPPKHLERLVVDMFQGLFPPIQPHATPLQSIRRVLLLSRESPSKDDNGTVTVNLRHYLIVTKETGLPKAIRRLQAAEKLVGSREKKGNALPNLSKLEDIGDYLLDPSGAGYTSASETEAETDNEVEVLNQSARKILSRKERDRAPERDDGRKTMSKGSRGRVEKRAVKLIEIGPRMRLRLTKVEEDLAGGKVLWHEFVSKTKEEVKKMDAVWEKRKKEKDERRRIQRENVERKRKEKGEAEGGKEDEDEDEDMDDIDEYDMDDDVWDQEADGAEDEEMEDEGEED